METIQQTLISEKQIITPLELVLNEVTPQSDSKLQKPSSNPQSVKESLDELFPEQKHEEKDIQKAKELLGPTADKFTLSELKTAIADIQYLVDSWLDDFERETFGGLTLKELLHEKGGL